MLQLLIWEHFIIYCLMQTEYLNVWKTTCILVLFIKKSFLTTPLNFLPVVRIFYIFTLIRFQTEKAFEDWWGLWICRNVPSECICLWWSDETLAPLVEQGCSCFMGAHGVRLGDSTAHLRYSSLDLDLRQCSLVHCHLLCLPTQMPEKVQSKGLYPPHRCRLWLQWAGTNINEKIHVSIN